MPAVANLRQPALVGQGWHRRIQVVCVGNRIDDQRVPVGNRLHPAVVDIDHRIVVADASALNGASPSGAAADTAA